MNPAEQRLIPAHHIIHDYKPRFFGVFGEWLPRFCLESAGYHPRCSRLLRELPEDVRVFRLRQIDKSEVR